MLIARTVAAGIILAGLAIAGPAAGQSELDPLEAEAPTIASSPSKAELEDIAVAAEEFGLPMETAIAQYGWRDNFSLLAGQIATDYAGDFARAEIVDGETAWIAFAEDQPRETIQLVETFRSAFPHVAVELRSDTGYTATSMNDAVVAIHTTVMAHPGVLDAVTEYWSDDNAILVVVSRDTEDHRSELSEETLRARLDLPELDRLPASVTIRISVEEGVELSGDDSWTYHYGGEALSSCTSGFGTVSLSGTRGISTAGHCGNSLTDDGRTLTYQSGYDGHWGDFQWHTGVGTETDDFYSGSGTTLEVNLRDVSAVSWASTGDWLCTNGKTNKKECDSVRNTGVCTGGNCNMFGMTNREQAPGDSGGPVFNGNTAYGLHEGYYTSGGAQRDTKSQANYMPTAINAYITTS